MKKILVLAVLAVALIATPAMAKEGVYLGGSLIYNSIVGSDLDTQENAGGLNLRMGYSFGSIAVEGNLMKTSHTGKTGYADADLSGLSIDLRVSFSQTHDPTQVYFLAGLGGYTLDFTEPTVSGVEELHGGGLNLGMGFEHFFNDQVALNVGAIYRIITYDEAEDAFGTYSINDQNGDTFSLHAGINLYF